MHENIFLINQKKGDILRKETKEILKLTTKEVLLSIFDLALPFFEADRLYRTSARKYKESRGREKTNFAEKIKYLKSKGLISQFVEGKEKYFEITNKGLDKISKYSLDELDIKGPDKWDGKWRVVIFDIPEKHKVSRNVLRSKLLVLGFLKIQESVYVYPFECTEEITQISNTLSESPNILIMISEIIQGEDQLINKFFEKGVLNKNDLKMVRV